MLHVLVSFERLKRPIAYISRGPQFNVVIEIEKEFNIYLLRIILSIAVNLIFGVDRHAHVQQSRDFRSKYNNRSVLFQGRWYPV